MKTYIIACVEENEQSFQLQFWDWENFDKWKVINAHEKYIWQIINLPKNLIASCSEDGTTKIFNAQTQQQIQKIAVHQASVNDIALITPDIIASVSDDGIVQPKNKFSVYNLVQIYLDIIQNEIINNNSYLQV